MKTYAYCRVSTERQSLARQIDNVTKVYPDAKIYSDKWTGANLDNRPNWNILYKLVRPGDLIVFDSVSRLSRDAEAGAAVYMELYERGVDLKFLNEPHVDTEVYRNAVKQAVPLTGTDVDCILRGVNEYMMILAKKQIIIAFEQAQKERDDIAKRVKDGMKTAVKKAAELGEVKTYGAVAGKKLITKKSINAKEIIRNHSKDFGGSLNDSDCQKLAGCSRNSFYKYKGEIKMEQNPNIIVKHIKMDDGSSITISRKDITDESDKKAEPAKIILKKEPTVKQEPKDIQLTHKKPDTTIGTRQIISWTAKDEEENK